MSGTRESDAVRISNRGSERIMDTLAIETPLYIEILQNDRTYPMGITMRTPGADLDLVVGFLYSEGIIDKLESVEDIIESKNTVSIRISDDIVIDFDSLRRTTLTTSACGVCGKTSLTNLHKIHNATLNKSFQIKSSLLSKNLDLLNSEQPLFGLTGGTHAAVAFDRKGAVIAAREDVGRHNALDKLIGHMIRNGGLNNDGTILQVSGRSSFELVQKTIRAGFPIMASVGAASSLAVELAREYNLTLVCFLKSDSMVVHSAPNRII